MAYTCAECNMPKQANAHDIFLAFYRKCFFFFCFLAVTLKVNCLFRDWFFGHIHCVLFFGWWCIIAHFIQWCTFWKASTAITVFTFHRFDIMIANAELEYYSLALEITTIFFLSDFIFIWWNYYETAGICALFHFHIWVCCKWDDVNSWK